MAAAKSEKEVRQDYTVQTFSGELLFASSSMEICGSKVNHFSCYIKTVLRSVDTVYYAYISP
jgi:hypothetical protein